jgi:hypothetical protein
MDTINGTGSTCVHALSRLRRAARLRGRQDRAAVQARRVAHFLVPVQRIWDDVVHTCGHQRIFCEESCVDTWLAREGKAKGYVMDLTTLWNLAAR